MASSVIACNYLLCSSFCVGNTNIYKEMVCNSVITFFDK